MPRFSIVVPAYRVRGYLRECLDSVLAQDHRDWELIAVDDRSPDSCGAIIDEYAAADPRITAVHLPENVGLGRARNAGTERATGDYVLYLDSDDTWTPGTLAALAARLDETGDPDVLVFDYARTWWTGKTRRNLLAARLAEAAHDPEHPVFTCEDRPEILSLLAVVWNKAYRRAFLAEHGFAFPPGYYEDTPFTFPVLLSARRIAALDRVCVHYRQRRQGNILRTTSRKHFDIFDQYDRVFRFLDSRPDLAERWKPVLFRQMTDHLLTILGKPGRVPAEARAEFFHRAAELHRRHRPEGHRDPAGPDGLKQRLLGRDAHHSFEALRAVNAARVRARRAAADHRKTLARVRAKARYRADRRRPLDDNLAVYSAYWGRGYFCNPAAVHAKARELAPHIHGVFVVRNAAAAAELPPGIDHVVQGTPRYYDVLARARFAVNNVNFPDHLVKRPGQLHLQTHHGTPLKHMGTDEALHPATAGTLRLPALLRRADRWDYVLSSNPHSTETWDRVYPASFETLEFGYPRNDPFYTAEPEAILKARAGLGIPDGTTAVLYAPTHRDYLGRGEHHPDPATLAELARTLGEGHTLLVRAHYFHGSDDRLAALERAGLIRDVSSHPSVEQLCLAADALITDYSSLMFDYANLDRPIVCLLDDWEIYRATRGTYLPLPDTPPGPVAATAAETAALFRSGAWNDPRSTALRAAFRERFCTFDDGRAAERTVRRLFLGETDLPPITPLADRTPAVAPGEAAGRILKSRRGTSR